jgi:deazaflavin-dependent oxidoreductase (nitroreductase family)
MTTTRGAPGGRLLSLLARLTRRLRIRHHRHHGDTFRGNDVLYLTTVGARSGKPRQHPLGYLPDGPNAWLIVASLGGAAHHPAWFHNLKANPDRVSIEVAGHHHPVTPEHLKGPHRVEAWTRIIAAHPSYATYQAKTDRVLPVLRLTRTD